MGEEVHIPLESLLISNSTQHVLEEEAQIPLESVLISIRKSKLIALEEEGHIPL
jgi:hypothetical protein